MRYPRHSSNQWHSSNCFIVERGGIKRRGGIDYKGEGSRVFSQYFFFSQIKFASWWFFYQKYTWWDYLCRPFDIIVVNGHWKLKLYEKKCLIKTVSHMCAHVKFSVRVSWGMKVSKERVGYQEGVGWNKKGGTYPSPNYA